MGMLERLRASHPHIEITAFDGHYARIGDADMHVLSHIKVEMAGRNDILRAIESGRRKTPHPKAIEERLERLIADFEQRTAVLPV